MPETCHGKEKITRHEHVVGIHTQTSSRLNEDFNKTENKPITDYGRKNT